MATGAAPVVPPAPPNIACRIEKLNPLAFPKGQTLNCDLTGTPAMYSLITEYTTLHFASKELAKVAWDGILCKIVHVMGKVLAQPSLVGSEEERERRLAAVHSGKSAIITLCREEAASHVVKGQFELAIPAAQYALRFGTSIYGEGSAELVPSYLLIAEANLGLARYRQAEEQLTLANWALLKTPHCSNALRSQLRRNFGRLYASQSKFDEALRQLADDVYYSSLMVRARAMHRARFTRAARRALPHTPCRTRLSPRLVSRAARLALSPLCGAGRPGAHRHLRRLLPAWECLLLDEQGRECAGHVRQGRRHLVQVRHAAALGRRDCIRVAHPWVCAKPSLPRTARVCHSRKPTPLPTHDAELTFSPARCARCGSDAKGTEGVEVLSHIRKRREECVGASNIATGESNYVLGLLYQYLGQLAKAAEHQRLALAIYENQLGPEHQSTKDVTLSLMQLEGAS